MPGRRTILGQTNVKQREDLGGSGWKMKTSNILGNGQDLEIIQNTNVMHLILFIRQIFSSTCFEQQVLIFRRNSCM